MRGILGIRCRKAEGMKAVIANTHLRSAYHDLYRGLRQRYARHKLGCFAACCDRTTGCQSSHDAINWIGFILNVSTDRRGNSS